MNFPDLINKAGGHSLNDVSDPEEIYSHFKMSKKAFKMAVGRLYKERKISFTKTGISLADN